MLHWPMRTEVSLVHVLNIYMYMYMCILNVSEIRVTSLTCIYTQEYIMV